MRKAKAAESASVRSHTLATSEGTTRYVARWRERFAPDFYRATRTGVTVSSITLGTYLGDSDDETDRAYADAIRTAFASGINVIDTAINYRCQRSERVVGRALSDLIAQDGLRRDEVVLCTKAGYIPLDGAPPASRQEYERYLRQEYFDSGILRAEDVVAGGHAIAPAFLEDQVRRSLRNLRVDALDLFYVHNPEQQLAAIDPAELRARLRLAFEALERLWDDGIIGAYGCATWNGLRLPAGSHGHLSLYELVDIAREVAGDRHHFRAVQLPVNLSMSEAVRVSTQRDPRGRLVHVLDAAVELGVDIVASAPLLQGHLTRDLPNSVRDLFPGHSDAQRALRFPQGLPAITTVATGMRRPEHVRENLAGFAVVSAG